MAESSRVDLPVKYFKSNHFRVVYAEGCFGGVSGRGVLRCAFWNERAALPSQGTLHFENGAPVLEESVGADGLSREIEAEVVMDLNAALAFHVWFGEKLEALRTSLGVPDDQWNRIKTASTPK